MDRGNNRTKMIEIHRGAGNTPSATPCGTRTAPSTRHRANYSLLLAHEVPAFQEGNTEFADTRRAFTNLDKERKETLRGG